MRVGVLTGGGDCPGLNAVIRAIVRRGIQEYGLEFVGFRDGWRGPLEADPGPLAARLNDEGIPVVGVPKTIDNDLGATDFTFGFDTAVNIGMEAIDRLHTTAESHHRALIVEVMGRHAGWIPLPAGLAGGANVILIPEKPFSIEKVCAYVEHRFQTRYAPIVVVAEGATPQEED